LIIIFPIFYQGGGDINGKLDEGAASLILDTKPSKVVSDERTVSIHLFIILVFLLLLDSKFI